jgi:hypothetical protein
MAHILKSGGSMSVSLTCMYLDARIRLSLLEFVHVPLRSSYYSVCLASTDRVIIRVRR